MHTVSATRYAEMVERDIWMERLMRFFRTDSPKHAVIAAETIINDIYGGVANETAR